MYLFPSFAEHTRVWIFSVCSFMLSSLLFHVVYKKYPTLCDPMECTVHGILQARILEWVAYPFSSRSSRPRNGIGISWIAGLFFTNWAIREALIQCIDYCNYNHLFLFKLSFFWHGWGSYTNCFERWKIFHL